MSALLTIPASDCDRCHKPAGLRVVSVKGYLCGRCWKALGEPPAPSVDPRKTFEQEQLTRERMTKRGGTDRHLVRKGIS